jgi:Leucine-rich repeat (LRR) protein
MFIFCATLFFVFPLTTTAQTVNIPDDNLRAAIEKAVGKIPNAQITVNEMATLRELRAVSMDIKNLAGLEAAVNLEDLRLNNNSISNISQLEGLIKLRHIELEENEITDLSPLAGLIGVDQLRLGNNLTDISQKLS